MLQNDRDASLRLASISMSTPGTAAVPRRTSERARRHFFEALSASYAPPALLVDSGDRIAATSGNLEPFLHAAPYSTGAPLYGALCDDVSDEVRRVAGVAREQGRPASGFVIIVRGGPIACKVIAIPLCSEDGDFLRVMFETPLAALAWTREI